MTARTARPHRSRRRWENRAGWWGILGWSLAAGALALAVTAAASLALAGGDAALSALVGGGIVLALSALTGLTTALAWDHAREAAMPLTIGMFVLKLVVYGLVLGVAPRPTWLEALPAGVGALVVIVVWQAAEVMVFARTRRAVYAD